MPAWEARAGGIRLHVRLTPRAGGARIGAAGPDHLAVRVAEAPVGGAANEALVRLLAKTLGVPKSAIRLAAGQKARLKVLDIDGDPAALAVRLAGLGRDPGEA